MTLRDKADKVLADFIIGKEVPGHPEQRYVRVPNQNQTYAVNFQKGEKVDLSTRFSDWIETNLLKLDAVAHPADHLRQPQGRPRAGDVRPGASDLVTVERKDATAPWTMEPRPPQGAGGQPEKLTTLTTALADLKIAGVRPKPAGLDRRPEGETAEIRAATQAAIQSLG